jgi:Xaa-Pro aminopeptidase
MSTKEFSKRRKKLARAIGKNSVAILSTADLSTRTNDTYYPFRSDTDFYYYTGFSEPQALMMIAPGRPEGEFILCVRPKDPLMETWDGFMEGLDGVIKNYDANESFDIADIDTVLIDVMRSRKKIAYTIGKNSFYDDKVIQAFNALRANQRQGGVIPNEIVSLEHIIHEMRQIKSRQEIQLMKRSARIGVEAHLRVMRECKPDVYEYQIEASIHHQFGQHGSIPSYNSIVASGDNACTLHYVENQSRLKQGDLLLTDAGCEYHMYASDITRTIPVSGKFTKDQKAIYAIVLHAQKSAIASVRPGQTFENMQKNTIEIITRGLRKLGILKGNLSKLIKEEAYKPFYMHGIGHWLGMDVHDVGSYVNEKGNSKRFLPGMVITVEPGIYISRNSKHVDKKWKGIGIRIEDDVLVTRSGCEVLSGKLPKEIDKIEAIMSSN